MTATLTTKPVKLALRHGRFLDFSRPLIMGVLNITPDSFSDGGRFNTPEKAIAHAKNLIVEGADIVDLGGESSRPGSEPVSAEEEFRRVIPVIEGIRSFSNIPLSVDTTKAAVAREALKSGVDIINDISALRFDSNMAHLVAEAKVPIILMHMLGTPKTMQASPAYADCVGEIRDFFAERIDFCKNNGIPSQNLILDPGIGFGKRLQDNLDILARLREFKTLERPLLVGVSRKSFISMITDRLNAAEKRIGGSLAAALTALTNGADIIRVHDVAETVEALKVFQAIKESV